MSTWSVFYFRSHPTLQLINQTVTCCPGSCLLRVNNMFPCSLPAINHRNASASFHLVLVINQNSRRFFLLFFFYYSFYVRDISGYLWRLAHLSRLSRVILRRARRPGFEIRVIKRCKIQSSCHFSKTIRRLYFTVAPLDIICREHERWSRSGDR